MKIKENKPEDYLPLFSCILKGDSPWATIDKCITDNEMDSGAVKACAKKVGFLFFNIPIHSKVIFNFLINLIKLMVKTMLDILVVFF